MLLLVLGGAAAADPLDHLHGTASLEYEAGYASSTDGDTGLGLAGARLRGQAGGRWLQYRMGLDLRAGMTWPAGFAYDVDLYAGGLGVRLSRWSRFGIAGGVGASGATGTLDDGAEFPVEAMLELALGGRLRVIARGRAAWLAGADARTGGAPLSDELEGSLALRFGHRWHDWDFPTGNGYYLGGWVREASGVRMFGIVIGHSLDAGTDDR